MTATFWNPPTPETDEGWKVDAAIWIDPGRQSGEPCFYGTRIPIYIAANWCGLEGESVESFMCSYDVDRRSILAACAWWALHYKAHRADDRRQQKAWTVWAEDAWKTLWGSDAESTAKVSDPPRSAKW